MKYLIDYGNIQQIKDMIPHSEYVGVIIPNREILHWYESKKEEDHKEDIARVRRVLAAYGDWFTDQSPLAIAIETGYLKLPIGTYKVKITSI